MVYKTAGLMEERKKKSFDRNEIYKEQEQHKVDGAWTRSTNETSKPEINRQLQSI